MERLGLNYESIRAVNRAIIYAGLFGFARSGPYAAKAAYDDLIQGVAGIPPLMLISGSERPRYSRSRLRIARRLCLQSTPSWPR